MTTRLTLATALAASVVAVSGIAGSGIAGAGSAARAEVPMAHPIELGEITGIAYYTVEEDGYRVVATLAEGAEAHPIRIVATLSPNKSIVLSTPAPAGEAAREVEIRRDADALSIRDLTPAMN